MHAQKRGTSIVDHFFTTKFILRLILTVDARSTGTRTFKSNPLQRQIVCHPTSVIFNRSTMSAGPNVGRSSTVRRFEYERSSIIRSPNLSNPHFFLAVARRSDTLVFLSWDRLTMTASPNQPLTGQKSIMGLGSR